MNSEQLKALIENTIDETLESYLGDPDEGKTLKEEVKQCLLAIKQRREVLQYKKIIKDHGQTTITQQN